MNTGLTAAVSPTCPVRITQYSITIHIAALVTRSLSAHAERGMLQGKAKAAGTEAKGQAESTMESVKQSASKAYESAKDSASKTYEKAKDAVGAK